MASEKNLNLKKETVQTIVDKIKGSETVLLFTYQGLSVSDISELRRNLRDTDAEVKVYKNTLVKRAFDELKLDLNEFLAGPNAMMFSKSLLESIKALTAFAKDHESLNIRAGIIKGDVVDLDVIREYSVMPSMEELLTMLAGGMIEHVKNLSISLNLYAEDLNGGKPLEEEKAEEPVVEEAPVEEAQPEVTEEAPTENTPVEETPQEQPEETPTEEPVVEETAEEVVEETQEETPAEAEVTEEN